MPEISRFFGIIITMNYNDRAPPHFHARYGSEQAIVEIAALQLLGGRLSESWAWWWSGRCGIATNCSTTGGWRARARH